MSSHHFVKEGQEPALLILDADSSDVVMSLLEWSPTILVSAEVLSSVLSWGIKIDGIVTMEADDTTKLKELLGNQGPVKIISKGPTDTYLAKALSSLKQSGQKSVNIVSKSPMEHFTEVNFYLGEMNLAFVNDTFKWIPVAQKFEKWYPADTILKFHQPDASQTLKLTNCVEEVTIVIGRIIRTGSSGLVTIRSDCAFWLAEPSS